jgi:phasin family protein
MSSPINPFVDLQTMMAQFQIPGVDLAAIVEARRKDIDALVAANQSALEAAQAVSRKQMEMLTQAMNDIQRAARAGTAGPAGFDAAAQSEAARKAIERAIADMKELAEMAQHAQKDTLAHLTARANEHLEEIRSLVQPAGAGGKGAKK